MGLQRGLHWLSLFSKEHVLVCNPGLMEILCVIYSCNAAFNYCWYLPKNEMGWVLLWLHETQGNMEVIEIQAEAFVHVHLILTPEGVTAAHIYTAMRRRGHAIVCAHTYTHSDTQYQ